MSDDWLSLLRARVAEIGVSATARELGVSHGSVSTLIAEKYPGNTWTNAARDLAQFSARFGRPLTYKLSKLAHYMQKPGEKFLRAFIFMLRA